jgi:hypothetical protein
MVTNCKLATPSAGKNPPKGALLQQKRTPLTPENKKLLAPPKRAFQKGEICEKKCIAATKKSVSRRQKKSVVATRKRGRATRKTLPLPYTKSLFCFP